MSKQPYYIDAGYLTVETIMVADMPRSVFVRMVEKCIDSSRTGNLTNIRAALRDELLPVANTMPRFPLGTWLDANRGCGCLVGEYLVATSEMGRAELVDAFSADAFTDRPRATMRTLIDENPLGPELIRIGEDIDARVRFWIEPQQRDWAQRGWPYEIEAVVLVD